MRSHRADVTAWIARCDPTGRPKVNTAAAVRDLRAGNPGMVRLMRFRADRPLNLARLTRTSIRSGSFATHQTSPVWSDVAAAAQRAVGQPNYDRWGGGRRT